MFDRTHGVAKRLYRSLLRLSLTHNMTHGIAVSEAAAQDLFGPNYSADARVRIVPCAIDYAAFRAKPDRLRVRAELGIAPHAKVVGHIGRFEPQKNHELLIEAFAIAATHDPHLHLLLVGDGSLRSWVEQRLTDLGLQRRATSAGLRSDVPRMLAAMDAFAFPSIHEGLGLVLIEAQASGLPMVVSATIPRDALISNHWIKLLEPSDAAPWAAAMLEATHLPSALREPSTDQKFDIESNVREWAAIYSAAA
jgi:glycosyltransferase involved in cell wall biosynthesis